MSESRRAVGNDLRHRAINFTVQHGTVDGFTALFADEQIGQRWMARQAADMCRKNAVLTGLHVGCSVF